VLDALLPRRRALLSVTYLVDGAALLRLQKTDKAVAAYLLVQVHLWDKIDAECESDREVER
jgi:hypothetical protein